MELTIREPAADSPLLQSIAATVDGLRSGMVPVDKALLDDIARVRQVLSTAAANVQSLSGSASGLFRQAVEHYQRSLQALESYTRDPDPAWLTRAFQLAEDGETSFDRMDEAIDSTCNGMAEG